MRSMGFDELRRIQRAGYLRGIAAVALARLEDGSRGCSRRSLRDLSKLSALARDARSIFLEVVSWDRDRRVLRLRS